MKVIPAKHFDKLKRASNFARISATGNSGWNQVYIRENIVASSDCIALYYTDAFDGSLFQAKQSFIQASDLLSCSELETMEIHTSSLRSGDERKINFSPITDQDFFQSIENVLKENKFKEACKLPKETVLEIQKVISKFDNKASMVKRVVFFGKKIFFLENGKVKASVDFDILPENAFYLFDYDYLSKILRLIKNPEIAFSIKDGDKSAIKISNAKEFCLLAGMSSDPDKYKKKILKEKKK